MAIDQAGSPKRRRVVDQLPDLHAWWCAGGGGGAPLPLLTAAPPGVGVESLVVVPAERAPNMSGRQKIMTQPIVRAAAVA